MSSIVRGHDPTAARCATSGTAPVPLTQLRPARTTHPRCWTELGNTARSLPTCFSDCSNSGTTRAYVSPLHPQGVRT